MGTIYTQTNLRIWWDRSGFSIRESYWVRTVFGLTKIYLALYELK